VLTVLHIIYYIQLFVFPGLLQIMKMKFFKDICFQRVCCLNIYGADATRPVAIILLGLLQ